MISLFDGIRDISFLSILIRMIIAFLCGMIVGFERFYKNRPAGFRTHILVCVGAACASVTGIYLYTNLLLPADISRIGAQVITGLGFLGGGTIILTKDEHVKGLTTAAGLWACGVIGLAIGAGFYEGGLIATFLVLISETYFASLSNNLRRAYEYRLIIHYEEKRSLDDVLRYCKDERMAITNLQITSYKHEEKYIYSAVVQLRTSKNNQEDIMHTISSMNGIMEVEAFD